MSDHATSYWFEKFRFGALSFCHEPRSDWPQVYDDKVLKAAIEENNRQTCGELAERFHVSDETVRHHLHREGVEFEQVGNLHAYICSRAH